MTCVEVSATELARQLPLGDVAHQPLSWQEGQRVEGPKAWQIATSHNFPLRDLVPLPERMVANTGDLQPLYVPGPPLMRGDSQPDVNILLLLRLYNSYRSRATGKKVLVLGGKLPSGGRWRTLLLDAADFFSGHLSPAAWIRWSHEAWEKRRPSSKAITGDGVDGFPTLQWMYAGGRMRHQQTVNIFTHSWEPLFRQPPVKLHAQEVLDVRVADMQRLICEKGFSTASDLRSLCAPFEGAIADGVRCLLKEREVMNAWFDKALAEGTWIWPVRETR